MRTKFLPYTCRYVNEEGAWLACYYDKDGADWPAGMMIKGAGIKKGDAISIAYLMQPASARQIVGLDK
jgi:hypothetical protein